MLSFLKLKKKAQSSKSPFKEGRWDIIKGIHSIHSAQWQTSCIKRTELPHLLVIQMPLVLINCSFTIVKSFIPLSSLTLLLLLAFTPQSPLVGCWGGGGREDWVKALLIYYY
jgi:hypothetical protein